MALPPSLAWSLGKPDNALSREQVLRSLREIVAATDVPLNADFENGFGENPAAVADSVSLAVAAGVAGLSIEDSTGLDETIERLQAYAAAGADCLYAPGLPGAAEISAGLAAAPPHDDLDRLFRSHPA